MKEPLGDVSRRIWSVADLETPIQIRCAKMTRTRAEVYSACDEVPTDTVSVRISMCRMFGCV